MKGVLKAFPVALRMILTDPVNFVLAVIPTIISLAIYLFTITGIYRNSDRVASWFRGYVYTADQATIVARILTAVLIIFVFFLMSWTFVLVVGMISAPFNSLLSARIEQKLVQRIIMDEDQKHALNEVRGSLARTFKNEFKKLIFLAGLAALTFVINLIPLLYPLGVFLVALLLAIQFVDYSWSRHNFHFLACLADCSRNALVYFLGGAIFLGLVAIPLINAFVPALATSYFTVLWLSRNQHIDL